MEKPDQSDTSQYATEEQLRTWHNAADLLAALATFGREGVNIVLKIDHARTDDSIYTVVISGENLGENFFRQDDGDLAKILKASISFCKENLRKSDSSVDQL